jgi:hypothetical protein
MATPTTSEFLAVPINGTDLIAFFRGSNISRPLYLRYSTFLDILSQSIGGGTTLLLETNGVQNPSQTLLNLIQGSGITITDNGSGGVTIAATGGASFITSISDTADIDLDVTLSDLTASLTTTGVTPNTYGSATQVPQITVDSKGRITGVTLVNITAGTGSVISVATAGLISGGPITVSGTITTSMNTNKLVGRGTAGTGIMEEITLGTGLSLSGTTLNATGTSGGILHGTAAGTDTYTVTITGATAYADGDAYLIRFANGNTTSATLNINGQGAIPLYRNNDGPLLGGDVLAGGEMICVYNSTLTIFQCIGVSPNSLIAYVTNDDSVTITKGQPVYAFSGTGDRMTVKRAFNTGDATSAQTVGLVLSTSIAANQKGLIMMQGLLDGLSNVKPVNGWADGSPVYLGTTAGTITPTKQYAPNHLVYLGFVTTASPGAAGRIYVRVQNGFELDELHNVQAQTPADKDTIYYDNTVTPKQWKTAQASTLLPTSYGTGSFGVTVDGVSSVIQVGQTGFVTMPYAGTITGWSITTNAVGSIQFDVWKAAGAIPTIANSIVASAPPTLTSAQFVTSTTLTGWTTTFAAGDVFGFYVNSVSSTVKNATLTIRCTKS